MTDVCIILPEAADKLGLEQAAMPENMRVPQRALGKCLSLLGSVCRAAPEPPSVTGKAVFTARIGVSWTVESFQTYMPKGG